MAFSGTVNGAVPLDTDLLSQGDDAIRALATAVHERFASFLVDQDTDPVKLATTAFEADSIPYTSLKTDSNLRKVFFADLSSLATLAPGDTATISGACPGSLVGDVAVVTDQGNTTMRQLITRAWAGADSVTVEVTNPSYADAPVGPIALNFRVAVIKYTI